MRVAFDLSFSAFLTRLTAPERQHTIQGQACLAGVGSSPRPGPHIRVPLLGSLATYHPAVLDVDLSALHVPGLLRCPRASCRPCPRHGHWMSGTGTPPATGGAAGT